MIITPKDLAEVCRGAWQGSPYGEIRHIRESHKHLEKGLTNFLWVPEFYKTEMSDSNIGTSCHRAFELGAIGCLTSRHPQGISNQAPVLISKNPRRSVFRLANWLRSRSKAEYVFVCGSCGKSTTKNLCAELLGTIGNTFRSVYNYNSEESIDLMLANTPADSRFSVLEVAIGKIGEQATKIKPSVIILTMVDLAHIAEQAKDGYFGERALMRLIEKKTRPFASLGENGCVVLNADHPNTPLVLEEATRYSVPRLIFFGSHPKSHVRLNHFHQKDGGSSVSISVGKEKYDYYLGIPGTHSVYNSLAAIAGLVALNQPIGGALSALRTVEHDMRRGQSENITLSDGRSFTLIDETANCSVPSLRALFQTLSDRSSSSNSRRIAVLGTMPTLGASTRVELHKLAKQTAGLPIDHFFTSGPQMQFFGDCLRNLGASSTHSHSTQEQFFKLEDFVKDGDIIAFKSSRTPSSLALRKVCEKFRALNASKGEDKASKKSELYFVSPSAFATAKGFLNPMPVVEEAEKKQIVGTTKITFCGDTYLGDWYQNRRERQGKTNYLKQFGYGYSFGATKHLLLDSDCVIANLECALTTLERSPFEGKKDYVLSGDPAQTIDALSRHNISAVMLGNNHAMDYGVDGLRETLESLTQGNIVAFGAGKNTRKAQAAFRTTFKVANQEFKLAVISAFKYSRGHEQKYGFYATQSGYGVNNLKLSRLQTQVEDLKEQGYFVVVSPHWGKNYCQRDWDQKDLATKIIKNCGADLLLGHGPHVMNEFRKIDDAWVCYSVGNYIFNSEGEYKRHQLMPVSFLTQIAVDFTEYGFSKSLCLYPIITDNQQTDFQPRFLLSKEFDALLTMLRLQNYDPEYFDSTAEAHSDASGRYFIRIQL